MTNGETQVRGGYCEQLMPLVYKNIQDICFERIHQLTVKTATVAVECNKYQVKLGTNLTYYTTPTHPNLPLLSRNQLSPMITVMII